MDGTMGITLKDARELDGPYLPTAA